MKRSILTAITFSLCCFLANPAFADFIGPYDVSNWNQSPEGGFIDLSSAPSSILLISSDDGNGESNTDLTIEILTDGIVTFDWNYLTTEPIDPGFFGPEFDPFGYLLNGSFFQLTDDLGTAEQSGWEEVTVLAGDIFGFRANSFDSLEGPAFTLIEKFVGPLPETNQVPEPGTILLLGSGLVGLGLWKNRKTR